MALVEAEDKTAGDAVMEEDTEEIEVDALTCMREHIGRHMRGESVAGGIELDSVVTERERDAMHSTPFGRINDMLGAISETPTVSPPEKAVIQPPPVFKFTPRQFSIIETVHNRFLYYLFSTNPPDLAEVYLNACSEDEYDQFMDDFPAA